MNFDEICRIVGQLYLEVVTLRKELAARPLPIVKASETDAKNLSGALGVEVRPPRD